MKLFENIFQISGIDKDTIEKREKVYKYGIIILEDFSLFLNIFQKFCQFIYTLHLLKVFKTKS